MYKLFFYLFGGFVLTYWGLGKLGMLKDSPDLLNQTKPIIDQEIIQTLVTKAHSQGFFNTYFAEISTTVPIEQSQEIIGIPVGTTKLLTLYEGTVNAGIDLSQITTESVKIDGDKITVTVPAPRIQSVDISGIETLDYSRGLLATGPDTAPELLTQSQTEARKQLVYKFCNKQYLNKAAEFGKLMLEQLYQSVNNRVVVNVQPPTECGYTTDN